MKFDLGIGEKKLIKNNLIKNNKVTALALIIISIVEIIMIIRAFFVFDFTYSKHISYLISYVVLLLISLIGIIINFTSVKKPSDKIHEIEYYFSMAYVVLICSWSCFISYYDMKDGNYPIVFLTVFVSIPFFSLISPFIYSIIIIIGTIVMLTVPPLTLDIVFNQGYFINTVIYSIICILLTYKSYRLVKENYLSQDSLIKQVKTDSLTLVKNRRALDENIKTIIKNDKDHLPSIILCDIDNFKTINDTFGHQVGDECLKELAVELKKSFTEEHVYRFGGDEFVIISNLNEEEIIYRLKKINETLLYKIKNLKIQISSGVYKITKDDDELSLFKKVDKALYKSKHEKKGDITIA